MRPVDSFSELETYLRSQTDEGQPDSTGAFTLEGQAALEKMGRFQLPRDTAWILKIVQAAVAGECSALTVKQGLTVTSMVFEGGEDWSLEQVEQGFFDPLPASSPALNHLKSALWNVGFAARRPFQYSPRGSSQSLVWNGQTMRRLARSPGPGPHPREHRRTFNISGRP